MPMSMSQIKKLIHSTKKNNKEIAFVDKNNNNLARNVSNKTTTNKGCISLCNVDI